MKGILLCGVCLLVPMVCILAVLVTVLIFGPIMGAARLFAKLRGLSHAWCHPHGAAASR